MRVFLYAHAELSTQKLNIFQKQPSRGALRKSCSKRIQQLYRKSCIDTMFSSYKNCGCGEEKKREWFSLIHFNPIKNEGKGEGGGWWCKKPPPPLPVFLLSLLQMLELVSKTFWLLVLTLFPHCCKISRRYLVVLLNYWTWTKTIPQKIWFFWSNFSKIEVMITSLVEITP